MNGEESARKREREGGRERERHTHTHRALPPGVHILDLKKKKKLYVNVATFLTEKKQDKLELGKS